MPYDIISVPAEEMDLNDIEFSKDYTGSSPQEALSYIKNAEFSAKPLLQKEMIFYSKNGKTYVDTRSDEVFKSFPRSHFDLKENKAMEEFEW